MTRTNDFLYKQQLNKMNKKIIHCEHLKTRYHDIMEQFNLLIEQII